MNHDRFDVAGIPTTIAIIAVVVLVAYALKKFNNRFPQVAERIRTATPWMGWCEEIPANEIPYVTVAPRNMGTIRNHRW